MDFEATLTFDDIPYEVEGWYAPAIIGAYGEPGSAEDVDLYSISSSGVELSQSQEDLFLEKYGGQNFYEWLMDAGRAAYEEEKTRIAIDKRQ